MGSVRVHVASALAVFAASACVGTPVPRGAAAPSTSVEGSPRVSADPASASPTPPPAESRPRTLVIHGTGDVNLDPVYVSGHADNGFAHAWTGVDGLFLRDDLTVVNLECPAARGGMPQPKTYVFRCDPDGLDEMRDAGVEVASLANNHALDLGVDAMLRTRENLLDVGVVPVGAGASLAEAEGAVTFERDGRTIAVVAFGEIITASTWIATRDRPGINPGTSARAMARVVRAVARRADVVVVTIHWGVERSTTPTTTQRSKARAMIEAGADVIFGHHPHVLQPLEVYRGRPIFFSLGNFVWRRSWPASYRTGVAEVRITPDGRYRARLLPAYLVSSGHPELTG